MASGEDDRISELPDFLLVQIISLLPTKDAFTTCVLSKRWLFLPTFLTSFQFDGESDEFIAFVDNVLARSVSPKINKFQLLFGRSILVQYERIKSRLSLISRCLSFAVDRNVEHIVIGTNEESDCLWPESFYTCSSLKTLHFMGADIHFGGGLQWKSLKTLKLGSLVLDDVDIVNLLAGCPALETMILSEVEGFRSLQINSSTLKRLKFEGGLMCNIERGQSLEISAPHIQQLEISGNLYLLECRLVDVSSVVRAQLSSNITCIKDILADHDQEFDDDQDSCHDYHQAFAIIVGANLQKLSNAEELGIMTYITEDVCMLQLEGVPIPELKCKFLTLALHIEKINLYGTAGLLRASAHVETLIINMATMPLHKSHSHCQFGSRYLAKGDDIDLQNWISSFVFPKLKKVKIVISLEERDMDHLKCGFDKLAQLSEFLLKAATVLEEFVIILERVNGQRCSTDGASPFLLKFVEKLLNCQRSSTKAMIIFKE